MLSACAGGSEDPPRRAASTAGAGAPIAIPLRSDKPQKRQAHAVPFHAVGAGAGAGKPCP